MLAEVYTTSERYMHVFTLTERWALLGVWGRVVRVGRIVFGCVLSGALLLVAGLLVWFRFELIGALLCGVFAWAAGCMLIWRGVYPDEASDSGGASPPEPPIEGAPRPAPLRPFSPRIMSAQAELPTDQGT